LERVSFLPLPLFTGIIVKLLFKTFSMIKERNIFIGSFKERKEVKEDE
jgi:hypothetical protein